MRDRGNMRNRFTAITARSRNERGLAMVEYTPLLAVIALLLFFSVSWFGPWVYERLIDASLPLYGNAACPAGQYYITVDPPPANGVDRDLNGDGWYCMKDESSADTDLPGNGNNNQNADIKDNNRPNP